LCFTAVSGQVCTAPDIVGSVFETNRGVIDQDHTYILDGYTVKCEGIVTTWEFCYQILAGVQSVTFYPGIWMKTTNGGDTTYSLIQSNAVTFNPSVGSTFSCQNYTLPVTERFIVPLESVVGLYSNTRVLLIQSNTNGRITTYEIDGNQSSATNRDRDVNYNIAISVRLGK